MKSAEDLAFPPHPAADPLPARTHLALATPTRLAASDASGPLPGAAIKCCAS